MSSHANERADRIQRAVTGWPGITTASGEYGETDFVVSGRSIGHVHGGHQADIPFPRRIRDELVAAGRARPHHVLPESGWVSRTIAGPEDVDEVVALFRLSYERAAAARARSSEADM